MYSARANSSDRLLCQLVIIGIDSACESKFSCFRAADSIINIIPTIHIRFQHFNHCSQECGDLRFANGEDGSKHFLFADEMLIFHIVKGSRPDEEATIVCVLCAT